MAFGEGFQLFFGQPKSAGYTSIDVIALLKIDVLEEITTDTSGGNGIPIHIRPGQVRDRALDPHQSLAEALANTGVYLTCHRLCILSHFCLPLRSEQPTPALQSL